MWRDDADSLRDDDSSYEYGDDKDEMDPQKRAAGVVRSVEGAAGRGVEAAPATERESSSICDSSQATSAHGIGGRLGMGRDWRWGVGGMVAVFAGYPRVRTKRQCRWPNRAA